jgi:hypothetical protein
MSRIAFHRPARTMPPAVPEQRVTLAAPPQAPQNNTASTWLYILLPLLSSISMAAYMVTYGRPWLVVLGISFVVVSVGVTVAVRWQMRSTNRRTRDRMRARFQRTPHRHPPAGAFRRGRAAARRRVRPSEPGTAVRDRHGSPAGVGAAAHRRRLP